MADTKISNLPAVPSTITGAELVPIVQGGVTYHANLTQLASGIVFTNVKSYGATGDGVTDDRAAIQAGIDTLTTSGGVLFFPSGTYIIGGSGSSIGSREYGLLLKSNVGLVGASVMTATLKMKDNADIDLINTYRTGAQSKISLSNLTLDGNEANQGVTPTNGFNLWAYGITDLSLENVTSLNPASWGLRIDMCDRVQVSQITCKHSNATNSDGIHFVDTNNVTGGGLWVQSAGDDAFVIEALHADVKNYALAGIYADALTVPTANKRGILLLSDVTVVTGARVISNVNLTGCVVENASGFGVTLLGASYESVIVDAVVRGGCAQAALYLEPGTASYSGTLENCSFNIIASDLNGGGLVSSTTRGTISDNRIVMTLSNPGDARSGISLKGNYWTGSLSVDYNPNGTKVSPSFGILLYGSYNNLDMSCRGAAYNMYVSSTVPAVNNTIRLGYLRESVTQDLVIEATCLNNRFIGGQIQGTITNAGGVTNKFFGTLGATSYGTATLNFATAGDGTATFAHGLNTTPTAVLLQLQDTTANYTYTVAALSTTLVTVKARTASTGAVVVTGSVTMHYSVSL